MFKIITSEQLRSLRAEYLIGCRVELIHMDDPYNTKLKPGCLGTVTHIDDVGTIFVSWDCGSSLGVVYGEDSCRKISG
ncbi:MAG: DUF4314 domain-containing protein [Anaerovoracaceae bacterium]|nr:DUF4314 domain-containing protein [Sphaerochaetaceae bacterium]